MLRPVSIGRPLIRIGGKGDGGYLIPDDLDGVEACFSPGVASTSDFESELALRGMHSYMIDYSVDNPPVNNELFHFEKKFLGLSNDAVYTTLDAWMARTGPFGSDLLLQMDIEGAEYEVLIDAASDTLARFRIIVIEFHELAALFASSLTFNWLKAVFHKLLKDFDIVHIHPNNWYAPELVAGYPIPPLMEFTFSRKDRALSRSPARNFPHPLDEVNVPANPDFALPTCWHSDSA